MNIKTVVSFMVIVTGYDAYGCPSFPTDCRKECITVDDTGCRMCRCIHLVSEGNKNPSGVSGVGCPVFRDDCLPSCSTSMNDKGCTVCTCANAVPTTKTTTTTTPTTTMIPERQTRLRLCNIGGGLYPCHTNFGR
ncbi:hypothetical protein CHS0354_042364 [Potamilus streckersoni]|uniref:Uncharacterized protein n=1 Tax=Potamilus streckersoni TaxID=2493646 RepID=A0AAE0STT6_9BIVA|nr:hypothetical protein CHS0354_042364 [Potamilus streckersoni]